MSKVANLSGLLRSVVQLFEQWKLITPQQNLGGMTLTELEAALGGEWL